MLSNTDHSKIDGAALTYKIQWATWRRSLGELAMDVLGQAGEVLRLLVDGQGDDALGTELDLPGNQRYGFGLLQRGLVIGPKRLRGRGTQFQRHQAPHPRRTHFF